MYDQITAFVGIITTFLSVVIIVITLAVKEMRAEKRQESFDEAMKRVPGLIHIPKQR
jgi:hypothetical protein